MMTWAEPEEGEGVTVLLYGTPRTAFGGVTWFDPEGPFYPHTPAGRFGPMTTLDAAKTRVEEYLHQNLLFMEPEGRA